ncbi:X-ray repair cross-complementing protein 6-like [Acropora millepora]|uniref:X-ray repair cross-complementing protein 6-like n=1 Tax=Acropora millepora TaxID=45264 RepID=UPI001CF39AF6|nr:X-ray repair cross-complementing protein 6-like [Acropora millepora]
MSDWSSTFWASTTGLFGEEDEVDTFDPDQQTRWDNKDSLIVVIDCSTEMFEKTRGEIPFQLCIKCTVSVLKNKIISSDKDLIGLVFFGTDKSENPSDFKQVYVYQELDFPDANRILDLEKFLEDDSCDNFATRFGHNTGYSLNDVLWTCSNMFSKSSQKVGHKRIMLFTNNDNPHADNPSLQRQAKTKSRDLSEIGIEIDLMHMQPPNRAFDASLFYQDVIQLDEDECGILPDPAEMFEELLCRVQRKEYKKRPLATLPLTLADGIELGVSVYNLCRSATKSSYVNLDSHTNEEVKIHTKYICKDTGRELMPTDIKLYQMFGGEKVIFEKEEVASMKTFGDPGLLLMGFKPRSSVKTYHHIRPAQFLYPSEKSVSGSTTLFSALLGRCIARDVVPICRFIPRRNCPPRFVALLPQEEELDEHNNQVRPPGFHVIFLPFTDDLRRLKYEQTPKATTEQINKAKQVIKNLTSGFDSSNFENPSLQKHFKNLEALALDRDEPEELIDHTEPKTEAINRKAGEAIKQFKDVVFPDDYDPLGKPAATKRKAGTADGSAAKKGKAGSDVEIDMREEAQKGRLSKLTVPVLKDFVKQAGIKCGTKKADLVEAIKSHFGFS